MPEMRTVDRAIDFYTSHTVTRIARLANKSRFNRAGKTGPTRARIKLVSAVKKRRVTAYGKINAVFMGIPIGILEWLLCTLLAGNSILLRRQELLPFSVRVLHFGGRHVDHGLRRQAAGGFRAVNLAGSRSRWRRFVFRFHIKLGKKTGYSRRDYKGRKYYGQAHGWSFLPV